MSNERKNAKEAHENDGYEFSRVKERPWKRGRKDSSPRTYGGSGERKSEPLRNLAYSHGMHPGLVPGISVDDRKIEYRIDRFVVVVAAILIGGFIVWGLVSTESLTNVSSSALSWVVNKTGWLFSIVTVTVLLFLIMVAFSRYGDIPLGLDNERPEYSFKSWVAMLFSAGMGIGLLFFGAYEPMVYFLDPPPGFDSEPGSYEALNDAMAQTMLHWGLNPWAFYAIIGAAIAYSSYRRGRAPLISRIFTPLLGKDRCEGIVGRTIDLFSIVATLFGTATSLGVGALQIAYGVEIVSGIGKLGNAGVIIIISILTAAFIASAVSGVSKGIRWLSNINMTAAFALLLFIFATGPTVFLLNLIPSTLMHYLGLTPQMLSASASWGPEAQAFVSAWTVFYWAWWISWSPFVGIFIAKISRGRTLRQFVSVVLIIPTTVSLISFSILGGTAMYSEIHGARISDVSGAEEMFFKLLESLPGGGITTIVGMFCITIFFVTSADSASVVMGTLSQQGNPTPNRGVIVFWGLCLSGIAIVGLMIGEDSAIQGLQNLVIVTALPFSVIIAGVIVSFWKDLATDPMSIRVTYAKSALKKAVRRGIAKHGDDFHLMVAPSKEGEGAGAEFDSEASEVTEWYQDDDAPEAIVEGVERVAAQAAEDDDQQDS